MKHALQVGYRHIDGAHVYENEKEVGEGIKAAMAEFDIMRYDVTNIVDININLATLTGRTSL